MQVRGLQSNIQPTKLIKILIGLMDIIVQIVQILIFAKWISDDTK